MTARSGKQSKEDKLIDLDLHPHIETENALLVSENGDKRRGVWLPLSLIEVEVRPAGGVTVTLPTWLATRHGLI